MDLAEFKPKVQLIETPKTPKMQSKISLIISINLIIEVIQSLNTHILMFKITIVLFLITGVLSKNLDNIILYKLLHDSR